MMFLFLDCIVGAIKGILETFTIITKTGMTKSINSAKNKHVSKIVC